MENDAKAGVFWEFGEGQDEERESRLCSSLEEKDMRHLLVFLHQPGSVYVWTASESQMEFIQDCGYWMVNTLYKVGVYLPCWKIQLGLTSYQLLKYSRSSLPAEKLFSLLLISTESKCLRLTVFHIRNSLHKDFVILQLLNNTLFNPLHTEIRCTITKPNALIGLRRSMLSITRRSNVQSSPFMWSSI